MPPWLLLWHAHCCFFKDTKKSNLFISQHICTLWHIHFQNVFHWCLLFVWKTPTDPQLILLDGLLWCWNIHQKITTDSQKKTVAKKKDTNPKWIGSLLCRSWGYRFFFWLKFRDGDGSLKKRVVASCCVEKANTLGDTLISGIFAQLWMWCFSLIQRT